MKPAACASAEFVAVGDTPTGMAAEPAAPGRNAQARVVQDESLRHLSAGLPQTLGGLAFALVVELWLLPASAPRGAWGALTAPLIVAAAIACWPGARASAPARRRRLRIDAGLCVAAMAALAVAPWLPGAALSAGDRLLLALALAPSFIGGAATLAPLHLAMASACTLPVCLALVTWHREGAPGADVVAGLAVGSAALVAGLAARAAWRRALEAAMQRHARLRALEAARDAAVRADKDKRRFLASASHDLRQPVQALGLFATTLENRLRGSGEETIVRNIVRSIDSLDRSFNAMLDISRLDAGAVEPSIQHFPVRDLFRRLEMYFAGPAEQARLGLRLAAGGKSVTSDPQLLERILGNLIQNAIKYTERGGIVVLARTTATHYNIEVWDTGMGIRATDLPHIFEEFFQVGRRERARVQGLGMGLAIVKRLASLLGHRLTVRSQLGRGTMFRIGIPIGGLPGIEDATAAADTLPMMLEDARTVLVLDDEEAVREGLALLLEEWGYQAIAAASCQQAERLARTLDIPPDLVLSDLHLGDGPDGIEAIAAVRRECARDMPAILITGDTTPEELRRAEDSGHLVLCKPVQPRKLLNALRTRLM